MKQLTCEMCGSTDLLKQDGVFVCQTCGTKYSVEEAKKMMIEGTVDVSGSTIKVDNSDAIENYMSMAENAYDSGNKAEAEAYCNKVIELAPQNYNAWKLKGQSAGWQSTLANIRLNEAINCFLNAIQFAPDEPQPITLDLMGTEVEATINIRKKLINETAEEIMQISVALVNLQGEHFAKWPDEDEKDSLKNIVTTICQPIMVYMEAVQVPVDIMPNIATAINNSVMKAWNNIVLPEYVNDDDSGYPSDRALDELYCRARYCMDLLEFAIGLSNDDDEEDIVRYKNLIAILEVCNSSCSFKSVYFNFNQFVMRDDNRYWREQHRQDAINIVKRQGGIPDVNNNRAWFVSKSLSDSVIKKGQAIISQCNDKIAQCNENIRRKREEECRRKEQEQRERNEAYWSEHAEEKRQLESERDTLQAQLKQLQEQYAPYESEIEKWKDKRQSDTPAQEEKKTLTKQISLLRNEQSCLGLFKGKEKKALQAQIDELSGRLPAINESIEAEEKEQIRLCNDKISELEQQSSPIKDKIAAAQKRINEIKTELTKNR